MKKISVLLLTILSAMVAKAQVISLGDGRFAIKNHDRKFGGDGTGTCIGHIKLLDLNDKESYLTFPHPQKMSSAELVFIINQASTDEERIQIIDLLKKE